MICKQCGKTLNDDFKLCPYCGFTIITDNSIDKENQNDGMYFTVAEREVWFSKDIVIYNSIKKQFVEQACILEQEFIQFYSNRNHSFDGLFSEEIPEAISKLNKSVSFGVSVLMNFGIDYITGKDIIDLIIDAEQLSDISDMLDPIIEGARKIQDLAESMNHHRSIQRANRGHWEGGGFGLSGAIKGTLTAGALNAVGGMFHGIGDSITDSNDRIKISKLKEKLANATETFDCLKDMIYYYTIQVFLIVKEFLLKEDYIPNLVFESRKVLAVAENYVDLYKQNKDDQSIYNQTIDILCQCIQRAPYVEELYCMLYSTYLGSKDEIHKLARFFSIERNYSQYLIQMDSTYLKLALDLSEKTPNDIQNKIEVLNNIKKDNPYIDISKYVERLNNKLSIELEYKKIEDLITLQQREAYDTLKDRDIEKLWNYADNNNVFAEQFLFELYKNICEPYYDKLDEEEQFNNLLNNVYKKANNGNELAIFIIAYIHDNFFESEIVEIVKKCYISGKYAIPLYITGFYGLLEKGPRNSCFSCKKTGLSLENLYEFIIKAADMFLPMALNQAYKMYKSGKGLIHADKNREIHYNRLRKCCIEYANVDDNKKSGGCFITSAVCKSLGKEDNCYELNAFRQFRDNWLIGQSNGEALIKEYYNIAPNIVNKIDATTEANQIYKNIWNSYLKPCLKLIESKEYERCKELYCEMVIYFKNKMEI